jgi:hypothetical protein
MSETPDTQLQRSTGADVQNDQDQMLGLSVAGFNPEETTRLIAARRRAQDGSLNEWTEDFKRLRFARWLYEQGRLES